MAEQRKLRVGMVGGGGPKNFFGAPHRTAILMDNTAELTAGASFKPRMLPSLNNG